MIGKDDQQIWTRIPNKKFKQEIRSINSNKKFVQSRPKRTEDDQDLPKPTAADQSGPKPTKADHSWRKLTKAEIRTNLRSHSSIEIWRILITHGSKFGSNFDESWSHMDRNSDRMWSYLEWNLDRHSINSGDRNFERNLSNLIKFEPILVSGASKIVRKSVPGPSWGTPGRPRSARGRPGASPARSGSAPRASRERPLSTKWGNFEGSEFEQIQEPKFWSHFGQAEPQIRRISDQSSSKFNRFLDRNLIEFGNPKTALNSNRFR